MEQAIWLHVLLSYATKEAGSSSAVHEQLSAMFSQALASQSRVVDATITQLTLFQQNKQPQQPVIANISVGVAHDGYICVDFDVSLHDFVELGVEC